MSINVKNISFTYNEKEVLHDISFSAGSGDVVAVLGPNGVGKSTFFRCMLGFLHPQRGEILLNGQDIFSMTNAAVAREIAYIPQSSSPAFNYTVLDTVLMGMTNQIGLFSSPGPAERKTAMAALEELGIAELAGRGCNKISGGERQLMLLARSLVQKAKILIMDEPTANLDLGNSHKVMKRILSLSRQGYTVIFSTHEPNQAFQFANRVVALQNGRVLAEGKPEEALSECILSSLYASNVAVREIEVNGKAFKLAISYDEGE